MAMIVSAFACFLPYVFIIECTGLIFDMVITAFRSGRI